MHTSESVKEQAIRWAIRLEEEDVTDLECQEFQNWVLADPAHEEAFLAEVGIGALMSELALQPHTAALRLVPPQAAPRRTPWPWVRPAIAASILLVAVASLWIFSPWSAAHHSYVTGTNEQRRVILDDGSRATLNTRTEVRSLGDRRVALMRGEALFKVVPDPARPFRVLIDDVEIAVLGTEFNAYRRADGTLIVSVLEGLVSVTHRDGSGRATWSHKLHADEQVRYRPGSAPRLNSTAASKAVRWLQGELEIEDDPLHDVLSELARYTDSRIVLANDPRLQRVHVGGVLSVENIASALALLERRAPIAVLWDPERAEYTVSYRAAGLPATSTKPKR